MSITTLRCREASGKLAAEYTAGGHRRHDLAQLKPELFRSAADAQRRTVAYARVSSHDQKTKSICLKNAGKAMADKGKILYVVCLDLLALELAFVQAPRPLFQLIRFFYSLKEALNKLATLQ